MTSAKTSTALAKMAGDSSGSSTWRRARTGEAPRSMAASSYSRPIDSSRARQMITGYDSWKVTRPSSWAAVPSWTALSRLVNRNSRATASRISGSTNDSSIWKLNPAASRPRQRSRPMAKATPRGTATRVVRVARRRRWTRAACSSGSCQTDSTGSCQYQRSESPCQLERERPALNENQTAITTGSTDQARYPQTRVSSSRGLRQGSVSHRLTRSSPPGLPGGPPGGADVAEHGRGQEHDHDQHQGGRLAALAGAGDGVVDQVADHRGPRGARQQVVGEVVAEHRQGGHHQPGQDGWGGQGQGDQQEGPPAAGPEVPGRLQQPLVDPVQPGVQGQHHVG